MKKRILLFAIFVFFVAGCSHFQPSNDDLALTDSFIEGSGSTSPLLGEVEPDNGISSIDDSEPSFGEYQFDVGKFDSSAPDSVRDYFLYLLESRTPYDDKKTKDIDALDAGSISYSNHAYASSCFYNIPLRVLNIETIEKDQTKKYGEYLITLDILTGNTILRTGVQKWSLSVSWFGYSDYIVPSKLSYGSKKNSHIESNEHTERIALMRAFAYAGTFNSPKDIPSANRIIYILTTCEQDGSQKQIDAWSEKLFETTPCPDEGKGYHSFVDDEGKKNYSFGGDPILYYDFINQWEDSDGIHYYYEVFNADDLLRVAPTKVLEYTIKDGVVWSCVDISDTIKPSPYVLIT